MNRAEASPVLLGYICEHALLDQADLACICDHLASLPCQERYALGRLAVEWLSTSAYARTTVAEELRRTESRSVPGLQQLLVRCGPAGALEHVRSCAGARLLVAGAP